MLSSTIHKRTDIHLHDNASAPMIEQGHGEKETVINDDVWIGYGAQLLAGVTIESGSIVVAGPIAAHDVTNYTVVAGVPVRVISKRAGH